MADDVHERLEYAALLPGVGVFGGVRRFVEIGNELVRRGHRYVIYHPDGSPIAWTPYAGEVQPLAALDDSQHDVVMCNDPPLVPLFERCKARLKLFYFALENIDGERDIVRHDEWLILANSTGMYERLRRKYGVTVEKVIGGIDLERFRPDATSAQVPQRTAEAVRILVFGRFSRRRKGAAVAVRAVESVARTSPARRIVLVLFDHTGPGNERDPRAGFHCAVPHEFHMNLTQDQLAALYAGCDLFVSAEKRAGWANTVAEAMACGVPVVCTSSGTRDLAIHRITAWVARWRHRYFVRRGIATLLGDPRLARTLRDNALEHIEQFSWPRVADQLEDVVARRLSVR